MGKQLFYAIILCGLVCPFVQSATLESSEYAVWGFEKSALSIPEGCVVTDAVLTIQGVKGDVEQLQVRLLDNPQSGLDIGSDEGLSNFFGDAGVALNGSYEDGDLVYRLADNDDPASTVWNVFEQPFEVSLTDSSTVRFSSSMLELLDYAATGIGFGFGLDMSGTENLTYYNVVLDVTVSPYAGSATAATYRYKLFELPDQTDPVVENLLVNGGLESGDTAWINYSSWNVVSDAANAYLGNNCMKFQSNASYSGDYAVYQYVEAVPGTTYSLSAMMKNDNNKSMRLLVVFQNASRRYSGHLYGDELISSEYQQSEMQFTVPSDCYNMIVSVCVFGVQQGDGTTAYADECVLSKVE